MASLLEGEALAVFRRREPGEIRTVALDAGSPSLLVAFATPDAITIAEYEAAASRALEACRKAPGVLERYGLAREGQLTDLQISAMARMVVAMESAILLWKDWNKGELVGGEPVRSELSPQAIAETLADPNIRAAWMVHLDAASPLERPEGNGSAASPGTTSGAAATIAEAVSSATGPAPGGSPAEQENSVPASRTPRKPPKVD